MNELKDIMQDQQDAADSRIQVISRAPGSKRPVSGGTVFVSSWYQKEARIFA